MVRNLKSVLLGGLLIALSCGVAQAQEAKYKLEAHRSVITSGGMVSTATSKGTYIVSGAISQAIIDDVKSDNYTMKQGFWTDVTASSSVADNFDVKTNGISNFPNPIKDFTKIQVELPGEAYVSVKIYDVTGNLVMSFDETYFSAESASFDWKATDAYGNRIASGNYVCEVTARSAAFAGANQFTPFVARKILTVVN